MVGKGQAQSGPVELDLGEGTLLGRQAKGPAGPVGKPEVRVDLVAEEGLAQGRRVSFTSRGADGRGTEGRGRT